MYLLVYERNQLLAYNTLIYGSETWGTCRQCSIIRKRKCWYERTWYGGSLSFPEDYPDEVYERRLNVVYSTNSVKDMVAYIKKNYPCSAKWLVETFTNLAKDVIKCYGPNFTSLL